MSDVGLGADPRDPRHLALRAVLEYQLGDDDAGAAYVARLQDGGRERHSPPGPIADHVFVALATPLAGRIANDDGAAGHGPDGGRGRALVARGSTPPSRPTPRPGSR